MVGFDKSDHDSTNDAKGISRRKLMKIAASAGATAILSADAIKTLGASGASLSESAPASARAALSQPSEWTGHNTNLAKYYRAPGYPAYDPHPRYLGELQGS